MNIFLLDKDPVLAARYHLDRHVVKMIQEYAQLLSTAHRVLDGVPERKVLLLPEERLEQIDGRWTIVNKKAMAATHANHPCAVWVHKSVANYNWLYRLFAALSAEKAHRYPNGPNATWQTFSEFLETPPRNITHRGMTRPALAMPVAYQDPKDPVGSYRQFYVGEKFRFARWTRRSIPRWFFPTLASVWSDDPSPRLQYLADDRLSHRTQITLSLAEQALTSFQLESGS